MSHRGLFWGMLLLGSVVVWLLTAPLAWPARALTTFLLVPLPAYMMWQQRLAAGLAALPPRRQLYLGSAATLLPLAGLTGLVVWGAHLPAADVGFRMRPIGTLLVWTGVVWAAGIAVMLLGHIVGLAESPLTRYLLPRTTGERLGFTALSLTAGFAEELVFRGFLLLALERASGSMAVAIVVSSVAFGIMHAYQDSAGAARAAVLGAILAAPLLATGSIYPSMLAHAAIDIVSGLWLAPRLLRG